MNIQVCIRLYMEHAVIWLFCYDIVIKLPNQLSYSFIYAYIRSLHRHTKFSFNIPIGSIFFRFLLEISHCGVAGSILVNKYMGIYQIGFLHFANSQLPTPNSQLPKSWELGGQIYESPTPNFKKLGVGGWELGVGDLPYFQSTNPQLPTSELESTALNNRPICDVSYFFSYYFMRKVCQNRSK